MIEFDWDSCERPDLLLRSLRANLTGPKLQNFLCVAGRHLVEEFENHSLRSAVENLEHHMDGTIDAVTFQANDRRLWEEAAKDYNPNQPQSAMQHIYRAIEAVLAADTRNSLNSLLEYGRLAVESGAASDARSDARMHFHRALCVFIRDIFPRPDRRYEHRPTFAGGGLLLPDGTIFSIPETARSIAEGIRQERAYDRLPILADALEDADCPDRAWLDHLRYGSNHVRGCWGLELALGRD